MREGCSFGRQGQGFSRPERRRVSTSSRARRQMLTPEAAASCWRSSMGRSDSTATASQVDALHRAHAVLLLARKNQERPMSSSVRRARVVHVGALISLIGLACASPAPRGADSATPNGQVAADDTTRLAQLEREARALVRATACGAASSCRTAPVGSRACGGPRDYVVYCAASTDTVALLRKLEELRRADMEYNERTG